MKPGMLQRPPLGGELGVAVGDLVAVAERHLRR